jgi:hypothetical protein
LKSNGLDPSWLEGVEAIPSGPLFDERPGPLPGLRVEVTIR